MHPRRRWHRNAVAAGARAASLCRAAAERLRSRRVVRPSAYKDDQYVDRRRRRGRPCRSPVFSSLPCREWRRRRRLKTRPGPRLPARLPACLPACLLGLAAATSPTLFQQNLLLPGLASKPPPQSTTSSRIAR